MAKIFRFPIAFIILALALYPVHEVQASVRANGTFTAQQACDAFLSKRKQTNPGHITLTVGNTYPVFEVNRANQPDWYRVRIEDAQPQERWVSEHCGQVDVQIGGGGGPGEDGTGGGTQPDPCRTAGLADSYILALSWQPAFCEGHSTKPECRIDEVSAYQARNFTLHGLWPNKRACGTHYGFCGEVRSSPGDFCDYPELNLFTEVREQLGEVMPSAAAGSCLQRHEWHKHGTCQTQWPVDGYYEQAVDLTRQFNESGVAYFVSRNIGKEVREEDFNKRVDCSLGEGAHQRLELKCSGGNLVDVYIKLPAEIGEGEALGALMSRAEAGFQSNCGGRFRIDPIGLGN